MKRAIMALGAGICLSTACIGSSTEEAEAPETPTGNGARYATTNGNVELLNGIHTLFDRTGGRCVAPAGGQPMQVSVGATTSSFNLVHVSSREELARELGIDFGLKIKYGLTRANASLNLVNSFSRSSRSVSFLLEIDREYGVQNRSPVLLTDNAAQRLTGDLNAFAQGCGTNYVDGVRYAAQLFVLISYTADSESTASEIKASLGVKAGIGPVGVTGDLKSRLATNAQREGVSVNVRVVSRGFDSGPSGGPTATLVADLVGGGVNDQTFQKIDTIRGLMQDSLRRDVCNDAGQGQCDGAPARGYAANALRFAEPIGVQLGFYGSADNAPAGASEALQKMRTNLTLVERVMRDYGELLFRMEGAYRDEIDPFLLAPEARRAFYNVAPPAAPQHSPAELFRIGNEWRQKFYPQIGDPVGWEVQAVMEQMQNCWNRASESVSETCVPPGADNAVEAEAFKHGLAELELYRDTARILELRVSIADSLLTHAEAEQYCNDLASPDGVRYRLPTPDEATRLAPLVGWGPIPLSTENPYEMSMMTVDGRCSEDPSMPGAFFYAPPNAEPETWCAGPTRRMAAVCVPRSGPVPQLPDP